MSATTANNLSVDVLVTTTAIVAANLGRREISVVNDGANVVYLGLGVPAVAGAGVRLNASGGSWTSERWDGAVNAIALVGTTHVCGAEF